ncbi:hypothetical protein, partial [Cupriavidus basilensis]|uniref:hypothetical protein n=1 Tax=Cupriavidus basilensis TaxID=68895 RepID=UPI00157AA319
VSMDNSLSKPTGPARSFQDETELYRIYEQTRNRNIGMITAHRDDCSVDENESRSRRLERDIREHGFGVYEIDAAYPESVGTPDEKWVVERSYLVVGKDGDDHGAMKGFLRKHGAKYEQDFVLQKAHNESDAKVVGISDRDDVWLKYREERSVGTYHPNRAGEFHWMLRNRDKLPHASAGIVRVSPSGFFGHYAKYVVEKNRARAAAAAVAEAAEKDQRK